MKKGSPRPGLNACSLPSFAAEKRVQNRVEEFKSTQAIESTVVSQTDRQASTLILSANAAAGLTENPQPPRPPTRPPPSPSGCFISPPLKFFCSIFHPIAPHTTYRILRTEYHTAVFDITSGLLQYSTSELPPGQFPILIRHSSALQLRHLQTTLRSV